MPGRELRLDAVLAVWLKNPGLRRAFAPWRYGWSRCLSVFVDQAAEDVGPFNVLAGILALDEDSAGQEWALVKGSVWSVAVVERRVLPSSPTASTPSSPSVGTEILRSPARALRVDAYAERWTATVRPECLDRLLIFHERQRRPRWRTHRANRCARGHTPGDNPWG